MKLTVRLGLTSAAILLSVNSLSAQFRQSITWIEMKAKSCTPHHFMMSYGVDTAATYSIDAALGEEEFALPPRPVFWIPVGLTRDLTWGLAQSTNSEWVSTSGIIASTLVVRSLTHSSCNFNLTGCL